MLRRVTHFKTFGPGGGKLGQEVVSKLVGQVVGQVVVSKLVVPGGGK